MRKKSSRALEALHETVRDFYKSGIVDQITMREYDVLCLQPVPALRPIDIKRIRTRAHVSQAIFAALLNTSVSTVQKWEIGQKRPTGTALKLLHLVQKNGIDIVAQS